MYILAAVVAIMVAENWSVYRNLIGSYMRPTVVWVEHELGSWAL